MERASRPPHAPVNLAAKLARIQEHWSPRVVAEINDYQLKLVKLLGEFVWHEHAHTDELFLVLQGEMEIELTEGTVVLKAGELFVVPRGARHITRAAQECHALVIEPRGVVNTGDAGGSLTAQNDVWV